MPSASHAAIDASGSALAVTVPHVAFTATVNGLAVSVDSSASYGTSSAIVLSSWDFGDGATATGATQSHTYSSAGTFTITYTATQSDGGSASTTKAVTVASSGSSGGNGDPGTPTSGRSTANMVSYSSLTQGSDMSATLKNGSGDIVSFAAGTYSFSDFTHGINTTTTPTKSGTAGTSTAYEYASGIQTVSGLRGLYGAGSNSTFIEMTPNSSNQSQWVPAQGSNLTNGLYLADMTGSFNGFVWDGINFVGTAQGHLYNGVGMINPGNATFTNSTFSGVPGNNGSPPGETFIFSLHSQPSNSTVNFTTCTFDGNQNGTGVSAAMLGTNTTNGVVNITDCLFKNNAYSAGIAIWELASGATANIVRPVMKNGHRNIGNEAQAGTINIYDPLFDDPDSGEDDIRITWTSNYNSGTINVYFTAQSNWTAFIANRTNKKILTQCTVTQSYGGSAGGAYAGSNDIKNFCHIYIAGVEQTLANYWTISGTSHN